MIVVLKTFKEVFRKTSSIGIAGVVSIVIFLFAVWLPNFRLIGEVITDSDINLGSKIEVLINLIGAIRTNFSILSASYTIAIAILFGINAAMMAYYVKKRVELKKQSGMATSFLGLGSGILGIGCAACGSFILSAIGAVSVLALLPLRGSEFGILSVALLGVSIVSISRKINALAVCKPN